MKKSLENTIRLLKSEYLKEGFIILGVFGSYARGEEQENSDIDILYETTNNFLKKYRGWEAFGRIEDIKQEIKNKIGKNIDLADKNGLGKIGEKYILPEVVYV